MKAFGVILLSLVAVFAGRYVYQRYLAVPPCNPPPGIECASLEHLRHITRDISKSLPKDISPEVRISRVWAREGEVVYDVRLINLSSRNIDREKFERVAFHELRKDFCASPKTRAFKHYGIVATFQISGNDGFNITNLMVGLSDC